MRPLPPVTAMWNQGPSRSTDDAIALCPLYIPAVLIRIAVLFVFSLGVNPLACAAPQRLPPQQPGCVVSRVVDGDTIRVQTDVGVTLTVRLIGMDTPEMLTAAGFPAAEGWYVTIASPHLTDSTKAENFVKAFKAKFGEAPDDYAITAYDASLVIIDAVKRLVAEHKPVNHSTVRDAIQNSQTPTLQGVVAFDQNGDIKDRTVSVFQIKKDPSKPLDDMEAQFHYVGVAPSA